jgi:hypothetical protein
MIGFLGQDGAPNPYGIRWALSQILPYREANRGLGQFQLPVREIVNDLI